MEGVKIVFVSFFCWPEDREFVGKKRFGASYSTSNKLLLIAGHIMTTGLQKCLSSWQCKIRKFTVTAFHCEESTHRKRKQPRDLSGAGQKSRELTTPPEAPNRPLSFIALSHSDNQSESTTKFYNSSKVGGI